MEGLYLGRLRYYLPTRGCKYSIVCQGGISCNLQCEVKYFQGLDRRGLMCRRVSGLFVPAVIRSRCAGYFKGSKVAATVGSLSVRYSVPRVLRRVPGLQCTLATPPQVSCRPNIMLLYRGRQKCQLCSCRRHRPGVTLLLPLYYVLVAYEPISMNDGSE